MSQLDFFEDRTRLTKSLSRTRGPTAELLSRLVHRAYLERQRWRRLRELAANDGDETVTFREVRLAEIAENGAHHDRFESLHAGWRERGVGRWLDLVSPSGPHPVIVLAALAGRVAPRLVGALVGVWAEAPLERFDDLLSPCCLVRAEQRPLGGAWHLIALTTDPGVVHEIDRPLVARALAWARGRGHSHVRTLSSASGLPALVRSSAALANGSALAEVVATTMDGDGRPALPVARFHLAEGAVLERVLLQSRRDDVGSDGVSLRFCYATDATTRLTQAERYVRWVRTRGRLVSEGRAEALGHDLFRLAMTEDGAFAPALRCTCPAPVSTEPNARS